MKKTLNKSIIIGHAASTPVLRAFGDGTAVANTTLYTDEGHRDRKSGDWVDISEKHPVVFRNRGNFKLAEMAANTINSGDLVYVEGSSITRRWSDGGIQRFIKEVIVDEFRVVSPSTKDQPTPSIPEPV